MMKTLTANQNPHIFQELKQLKQQKTKQHTYSLILSSIDLSIHSLLESHSLRVEWSGEILVVFLRKIMISIWTVV